MRTSGNKKTSIEVSTLAVDETLIRRHLAAEIGDRSAEMTIIHNIQGVDARPALGGKQVKGKRRTWTDGNRKKHMDFNKTS